MGNLIQPIQKIVDTLPVGSVTEERKQVLEELVKYVVNSNQTVVRLNFICTHNSRRSQFSQLWAKVASHYYNVATECLSGGTEATAFNERAVRSAKKMGFIISTQGEGNPRYSVTYSNEAEPLVQFSKVFDDEFNGTDDFAAIMTCSHADENCPFIPQAKARIPIRYNDPKAFDDTPQEEEKYDERSLEIATELFYVFQRVAEERK